MQILQSDPEKWNIIEEQLQQDRKLMKMKAEKKKLKKVTVLHIHNKCNVVTSCVCYLLTCSIYNQTP